MKKCNALISDSPWSTYDYSPCVIGDTRDDFLCNAKANVLFHDSDRKIGHFRCEQHAIEDRKKFEEVGWIEELIP